jgi:leader peptidase (prepilin peptidase) / N-methyltransferase
VGDIAALYLANPLLFAASAFLVGLVVGSFLNVVIYRLPIMLEREWQGQARELLAAGTGAQSVPAPTPSERFTLSHPRSACPACKAPIKAWQNVPLLSWVLLKGRCAACSAKISIRYPFVELVTGLLSAAVAWHFGFSASAGCALLITWSLIALTGIDVDHQLLPDGITLPVMWLGLLAAVLIGPVLGAPLPVSPSESVLGAACGYLSLWLVYQTYRLITGKEGMGFGDFKLFALLGAWLGYKLLPLIILLSAGTGAVLGIGMIVARGRDRAAPMPFGPYLASAGWIAMMWGNELVDGYMRISGMRR